MASIVRRGPKQYQAKVRVRGVRTSRTFATRRAAEAWAREVEDQIRDGVWEQRKALEGLTVTAALDRYLRDVTPKKRAGSADRDRTSAKHIRDHALASLPLSRVRAADVAQYRDDRLAGTVRQTGRAPAPATVNREIALLSNLFTVACQEWGFEGLVNPCFSVKKARVRNARDRRLRSGEWSRIMRACRTCRQPYLRPFLRLLVETACRRGELLAVRWQDVDLNRRMMTLPATVTKTGKGRVIPLSRRAVRIIRSIPREGNDGGDPLFPVTANALRMAWDRVLERAGIEDLRMHDLRHEATSRLFERGLDIQEVALFTGHETLSMLRRYTHLRPAGVLDKLG